MLNEKRMTQEAKEKTAVCSIYSRRATKRFLIFSLTLRCHFRKVFFIFLILRLHQSHVVTLEN